MNSNIWLTQLTDIVTFASFLTNLSYVNYIYVVDSLLDRKPVIVVVVTDDVHEDFSAEIKGFDPVNQKLARFLYSCDLLDIKSEIILEMFGGKIPNIYVVTNDWRISTDTTEFGMSNLKTYNPKTNVFE